MGQNPASSYYIITRRKQAPFLIRRLPEICSTIGFSMKRTPAYQFIARLRDYKPHLKDVLIVSSTSSTDVGLITRSDQPLASGDTAKSVVGQFTTTELNDDTKRASVPLKDSVDETSAIGLATDLSSTETVIAPIQGEDIQESSTPLPNLLLLNNDGILSSWWFIYSDSIRQKVPYPGLVSTSGEAPSQPPTAIPAPSQPQPAFGQPSFGSPSPFGASAMGKPSSSFGSPSQLGGTAAPAFGKPSPIGASLGAPSQPGPAFGAPSVPGQSGPQFGRPGFGNTAPTFGQPSAPVKSLLNNAPSGGNFSSFSGTGGFGGFAAGKTRESPFAKPGESAFNKPSGPSVFGAPSQTETAFPSQNANEVRNPFGARPGGFVLGSTFKGDDTAVNEGPKPDKPSAGAFSFGESFDEMISSPQKASPLAESMDDMEDTAAPQAAPAQETTSIFGGTSKPAPQTTTSVFDTQAQPSQTTSAAETQRPGPSLFGNNATQNQVTSPVSALSDKTVTPPAFSTLEAPLPPDPTSRAAYAAGDTSASSNVSKSSVEDAPCFTSPERSKPKGDEAPLPPDFLAKPQKTEEVVPEDAPLPPDPVASKVKAKPPREEIPLPDGSDADSEQEADESDFSDSGEEITHDVSPAEETESKDPSAESSFEAPSDKSSTAGLFRSILKPDKGGQLFGEIPKKPLLPPPASVTQHGRDPDRSPSPTRVNRREEIMARIAQKARTAERDDQLRKPSDISHEEQDHALAVAQQLEEEVLSLSDDNEDERLRAELARPVEPVATLDPFLPHQDYMGQTAKPGIAGQIERLYRDINSMVDTLGVNARSLESFLLYQQPSQTPDVTNWVDILQSEHPADVLDKKIFLRDIATLDEAVAALARSLDEQRVQGVEEKLNQCRDLLTKDIVTLRGQCASIRKTLDSYTDTGLILAAPLSAEQATLQHDLRTAFTAIQGRMADLEQGVSLLRAKIADIPRADSATNTPRQLMKRPTVEAVASTIATMMSMAENKSSDIDLLEAQMRKLGVDVSSTALEGSPFTTPRKNARPATPGSRGSMDGSAYHTPESASRVAHFRSSINGSTKGSRLRSVDGAGDPIVTAEESARWKVKTQRRQHLVGNLKKAIDGKKVKVRGVDDM